MTTWLAIALGGACGAMARYATGLFATATLGAGFPFGTMLVNVLGSFIIGFVYPQFMAAGADKPLHYALVAIGFLGAFTTFSTFSLDTIQLIEGGQLIKAVSNVTLNLLLCLTACWLGLSLSRM